MSSWKQCGAGSWRVALVSSIVLVSVVPARGDPIEFTVECGGGPLGTIRLEKYQPTADSKGLVDDTFGKYGWSEADWKCCCIPEPVSAGLLGLGLAAAGVVRLRRRRGGRAR